MKNDTPEKEMKSMDSTSMDIVADNISKLKELFPEAFTEGKVDFNALKEVLGDYIEGREERYSFTWNGKSKARMLAQTPSTGTLRPCKEESADWDSTQNLFIEGDNLEVLKLLQKSYHKKVKMIYIDPPYNTGNDFVYNDNFKDNIRNYKEITGQIDGEGNDTLSSQYKKNEITSGRYHTDWLNMMYPRLKLARNLLTDEGIILISIDDNEVVNLRKLCDEIYGEENFIAQFIWKCRKFTDARSVKNVSTDHEYILAYGKSSVVSLRGRPRDESKYSNPDDDVRGPWMSRSILGLATKDQRPNLHFEIIDPSTGISYLPPETTGWRYSKERMEKLILDKAILFPAKPSGRPREKKFRSDIQSEFTSFPTIVDNVHTSDGTQALRDIFGSQIFDFPKPVNLVQQLIEQCVPGDGAILDFFSGSGATAHAVMEQNLVDNEKRKFIVVQLPEATNEKSEAFKAGYRNIAEIGKERIRRVSTKIKDEHPDYQGDLGFKVFKLDSTNIKPWELDFDLTEQDLEDQISNIKHDRKEEDVLYEVLLKYGLDLTLPITEHTIAGHKVFDIGMGALMICLSDAITLDVVEGIATLKDALKPEIMRVVFKDAGFADDVVKTNAVQILKQAGIEDVRSL